MADDIAIHAGTIGSVLYFSLREGAWTRLVFNYNHVIHQLIVLVSTDQQCSQKGKDFTLSFYSEDCL